jgi:hypothetical protein
LGHGSGLPDLVAVHADGRSARVTIERLSRAGVDGGAIVLLQGAEVVTAGRYGDRQTDLGSSLALGGRILRGAAYGILPGAVFGAILLAVVTSPAAPSIAAGAAGGAVFGLAVGGLTSILAVPTMATSWERTFAPMVPGGVAVGVSIGSDKDDRRVRRVLRIAPALEVREVPDLLDLEDDPIDRTGT